MEINLLQIDWKKETNNYTYKGIENVVMKYPLEFRITVLDAIKIGLENDVCKTLSGQMKQSVMMRYNDCRIPLLLKIKNEIAQREATQSEADKYTITLNTEAPPTQITIPAKILQALEQAGFIENATALPLRWIKTNSRSKGKNPSKISLLDLLCLLEYSDEVIKNKTLLNSLFIFPNNKPLSSQNYTHITDNKSNLIRPIISEYHTELETIVKQG